MARYVYNYELFTSKKEQLLAIQKQRQRNRRIKQAILLIVVLLALLVMNILQQSRCDYYIYKDVVRTEENSGVYYETFADGYLKYSSNGIEYQGSFGTSMWNIALNFSKPFVSKAGEYVLIGDRGGNRVILFNKKGRVNDYTLKYPVKQLGVAENGNIEVILEGDECNYIQVYTQEGDLIAETKITLGETGYPVAAAISPDGSQLAVSYYLVEELTGKSRVVFYDFSRQIQMDNVPLKGGFDYDDTLIARFYFIGKNRLVGVGDNKACYYDISDDPKETKVINFMEKIESVFQGKGCIGFVCTNQDPEREGRYHLCIYDNKGNSKTDIVLNMNYEKIHIVGNEIFATKDNECTIFNKSGKILFQGPLEGNHIEKILPCPGWRTYRVVFENKIVKMRLTFFDRKKEG